LNYQTINGFLAPRTDREAPRIMLGARHLDYFYRFCRAFNVAVQAGGNIGVWPSKMAQKFSTVYTFEPEEDNFNCLTENVKAENVVKYKAALSNKYGSVGIHKDELNCGAHYIDGPGDIPVMLIDDLNLSSLDFLMLDVEGYELSAIEGGIKTILTYKPVIVAEDKHHRNGTKPGDLHKYLEFIGYRDVARRNNDVVFVHK
jgi:FkbM family methyltransferase